VQLSGGWEVALHADHFLVRRARRREHTTAAVPLRGATELGDWRFRPVAADPAELRGDLWSAALPAGRALSVRAWRPGDRIVPHGSGAPRRVKGVLRDAGIDAARRPGWPVVLVDDEIVWIPGVRRSSAATVRSGRPVVLYICERIHVS
jgi:tRNA(Ile)-lysidine synthase